MRTKGLTDIQVNGFAGVDFNSGKLTASELDHALEAMLATGVTACLPTLITAAPDVLLQRIQVLDNAIQHSRLGRLMCLGLHIEGPFLNPQQGFAGCHPAGVMTPPYASLIEVLQARITTPILLVTLAPELSGSEEFIAAMKARNILTAIGHSDCNFETAAHAASAGASLSTHLGNGLPQHMPKLDNPLFAQLAEDRLTACFIADGFHIPPQALKVMIRAKGISRSVLVTDAVSAAAAETGFYHFADMRIERHDNGMVKNPNGAGLAGSTLCLDQAVRNLVTWNIASFEEAVRMASGNVEALLAPVLAARGIKQPVSFIEWTSDLFIRKATFPEHDT